jgi:arginase family enzyme
VVGASNFDPVFAPVTGTPEIADFLPHEAVDFIRALRGIPFVGFDIVEVGAYDNLGQNTAMLAPEHSLRVSRPAGLWRKA